MKPFWGSLRKTQMSAYFRVIKDRRLHAQWMCTCVFSYTNIFPQHNLTRQYATIQNWLVEPIWPAWSRKKAKLSLKRALWGEFKNAENKCWLYRMCRLQCAVLVNKWWRGRRPCWACQLWIPLLCVWELDRRDSQVWVICRFLSCQSQYEWGLGNFIDIYTH